MSPAKPELPAAISPLSYILGHLRRHLLLLLLVIVLGGLGLYALHNKILQTANRLHTMHQEITQQQDRLRQLQALQPQLNGAIAQWRSWQTSGFYGKPRHVDWDESLTKIKRRSWPQLSWKFMPTQQTKSHVGSANLTSRLVTTQIQLPLYNTEQANTAPLMQLLKLQGTLHPGTPADMNLPLLRECSFGSLSATTQVIDAEGAEEDGVEARPVQRTRLLALLADCRLDWLSLEFE